MGEVCPMISTAFTSTATSGASGTSGSTATSGASGDIETSTEFASVDCITVDCKLWDVTLENCGLLPAPTVESEEEEEGSIQDLIDYLEIVFGKSTELDTGKSLIRYLQKIVGMVGELDNDNSIVKYFQDIMGDSLEKSSAEGTGSSVLRELNHMHGSHLHRYNHVCSEIPSSCGDFGGGYGTPFAGVLIAEFMGGEDLDNNGMIYGKDFMISDGEDKPPMLKAIEAGPDWVEPTNSMTWTQMMNSL